MSQDSIIQLNDLRDYIKSHKSQLEMDTIRNVMVDYIADMDLKNKLINDEFPKTVWYCLCNSDVKRDLLVRKLYDYLVRKGRNEQDALELISYALYLGDIDPQLSKVTKPNIKKSDNNHNKGPGRTKGGKGGSSSSSPKGKMVMVAVVAVAIVLLGFLAAKSCRHEQNSEANKLFSPIEISRVYEGSIEKKTGKRTCQMSISVGAPNELKVLVTNLYNQSVKEEYSGKIKKDELRLDDGPDLLIRKTAKGKIELTCNDGKYGKWSFVSK